MRHHMKLMGLAAVSADKSGPAGGAYHIQEGVHEAQFVYRLAPQDLGRQHRICDDHRLYTSSSVSTASHLSKLHATMQVLLHMHMRNSIGMLS